MRTWLGEGRIPNNALVWREGWPEWRSANDLFPGLGQQARPAEGTELGTDTNFPKIVTEGSPVNQAANRIQTQKSTKSNTVTVGILTIACVALFFVLISVLRG